MGKGPTTLWNLELPLDPHFCSIAILIAGGQAAMTALNVNLEPSQLLSFIVRGEEEWKRTGEGGEIR
jgi:hypothetical protein